MPDAFTVQDDLPSTSSTSTDGVAVEDKKPRQFKAKAKQKTKRKRQHDYMMTFNRELLATMSKMSNGAMSVISKIADKLANDPTSTTSAPYSRAP